MDGPNPGNTNMGHIQVVDSKNQCGTPISISHERDRGARFADARDGLSPSPAHPVFHARWASAQQHPRSGAYRRRCLGKYHPHGDGAVYDAMARMAQDFSMRYMLVDGQGNFGSVDGDPTAASMRLSEARCAHGRDCCSTSTRHRAFAVTLTARARAGGLRRGCPTCCSNGTSGIAVGNGHQHPPANWASWPRPSVLIDH